MIRVLIADDHPIVREGVRRILEEAPDITVAGEAACGQEALESVQENEYDVVLLDIGIPGVDGLDLLRQLRRMKPHLRALIVSMYPAQFYAVRVLRAGAYGYVEKTAVPEQLLEAIRKVSQGRRYVTTSLAEELIDYLGSDFEGPLHTNLTDREYQVMCLIAAGKTTAEMAEELSLTEETIGLHRRRTLKKMGIRNSAGLARYAVEHGLVY